MKRYPGGVPRRGLPRPWYRHTIVRVIAGGIALTAGALWLTALYGVLRSWFATDPAVDPHGYGLFFGLVLTSLFGLVTVAVAPLAVSGRSGARLIQVVTVLFAACVLAQIAALVLLT